jgi:hypothetical protein
MAEIRCQAGNFSMDCNHLILTRSAVMAATTARGVKNFNPYTLFGFREGSIVVQVTHASILLKSAFFTNME